MPGSDMTAGRSISRTDDGLDLDRLTSDFGDRVPGRVCAAAVLADGLLLAMSRGMPADRTEQFAAIVYGLVSLSAGAARALEEAS
ncbi:MAG: roadblock/LC7 domain-containing protein [Dermatophilaceae bacterium]